MKFKLLVFDWDGTLMDSEARIVGSMASALRDLGLVGRERCEVRGLIGLGLDEAIATLLPDLDPSHRQRVAERYRHHYLAPDGTPTPLFPDARQVVETLAGQGYLMGVATGKSRRGLERSFAESGLGGLFHATRCADETRSKPHPQMLLELMDELGVDPEHTLMIGDTEFDIQLAHNAHAAALAVTHGVHARDDLCRLEPLDCLDGLALLPPWLAEWSGSAED